MLKGGLYSEGCSGVRTLYNPAGHKIGFYFRVFVCRYQHVNAGALGSSRLPGAGVQAIVSSHMWVLGTKLGSSTRAVWARNTWATTSAPASNFWRDVTHGPTRCWEGIYNKVQQPLLRKQPSETGENPLGYTNNYRPTGNTSILNNSFEAILTTVSCRWGNIIAIITQQ